TWTSIRIWDNKLRTTRSLLRVKSPEENVNRFRGAFQRSPRKPIRPASLQLIPAPTPSGQVARTNFAVDMLERVDPSPDFLCQVCFSDEVTFQVNRAVNRCNCRICGSQNPHVTCELEPHFCQHCRNHQHREKAGRWIGRSGPTAWPPRSPDLNPVDFFLWGYVKNIVYQVKINKLQHMKARIRDAVATVTTNTLQAKWNEVKYGRDICSATKGAHTEIY
ncbi:hypothetical protein B7P43_G13453, partial [Cryptotermes secundus]